MVSARGIYVRRLPKPYPRYLLLTDHVGFPHGKVEPSRLDDGILEVPVAQPADFVNRVCVIGSPAVNERLEASSASTNCCLQPDNNPSHNASFSSRSDFLVRIYQDSIQGLREGMR